jgi:hypothetical protein
MKIAIHGYLLLLILALVSCKTNSSTQQILAFPEAQGYGKYTQGGRGGRVILVDSLEDSDNARPGTLRYAVKAKGPRTIIFNVSGLIHLVKPLEIKEDFVTIAGQTSPNGIVITGSETQIDASQVIIRYLRFRPGSAHDQGDAVTGKRQHNIIIDHCSMSWANDEVGSFYNNTDFTLQYSILSESLNNAGHKKGNHGYGGIWGGQRASFIYNVLAHHTSRNPRINGYRLKPTYDASGELVDIQNNVIYNWASNSAYGNEGGRVNLLNNTYKVGPAKGEKRFFQINFPDGKTDLGQMFILGNEMVGDKIKTINNYLGVEFKNENKLTESQATALKDNILVKSRFIQDHFPLSEFVQPAVQSYKHLIIDQEVGANRVRNGHFQDSVDQRILNEVASGSAKVLNGIIDSELQVIKSWEEYNNEFTAETDDKLLSRPPNKDVQKWIDDLGKFN